LTQSVGKSPAASGAALVVRVGETLYALPIQFVEEVLPALPIEPIPQAPPFLRGVVFVRGHWIPVLDAAERLGGNDRQRPAEPPIVCLSLGGKLVGLDVDEAVDLVDWSGGTFAAAGELGARDGAFAGLVEIDGQVLRLLDPEKLDVGQVFDLGGQER
jgi:chemotaxis signal transduction protein